jgi:peptidoglycan/LPS O-acetylase OafA/YrhL
MVWIAVAVDALAVVVFVAIGRGNHDEDPGLRGLATTAAPFLIGLACGWAIALASGAGRRPFSLWTGIVVALLAVAIGMVVRRTVFDEGTAASFVVVATTFVSLSFVGWRAVVRVVRLRSAHA